MIPERWFVRALRLLDGDLIAVWHPKINRWQIREWMLPHRKGGERDYYYWKRRSMPIRVVCYRDEDGRDAGYHPLDERTLYALKLSRHYSLNPDATARMVDESNAKLEAEYQADNQDIAREVAKGIWHHYQEPTVDIGQRGAY